MRKGARRAARAVHPFVKGAHSFIHSSQELAALLAPFVDGDAAERAAFVERCREKAAEMATTPFGELLPARVRPRLSASPPPAISPPYLAAGELLTHVCGRMYCSRAKLHLQKADGKSLRDGLV